MRIIDKTHITELSKKLVSDIVFRYDIKNYDEFSCPIIRAMAMELQIFN